MPGKIKAAVVTGRVLPVHGSKKGQKLKFMIDVGLHSSPFNASVSGNNDILYVCKQKEGCGEVCGGVAGVGARGTLIQAA